MVCTVRCCWVRWWYVVSDRLFFKCVGYKCWNTVSNFGQRLSCQGSNFPDERMFKKSLRWKEIQNQSLFIQYLYNTGCTIHILTSARLSADTHGPGFSHRYDCGVNLWTCGRAADEHTACCRSVIAAARANIRRGWFPTCLWFINAATIKWFKQRGHS